MRILFLLLLSLLPLLLFAQERKKVDSTLTVSFEDYDPPSSLIVPEH
ncbi:MAG: hypothetical protein ACJAWN_001469, partial [Neolewinella sp.]